MSRDSQKKACDVGRLSPYAHFWETCCRALSGKPPLVRSLCQNAQPLLEAGGRLEAELSSVPIVAGMFWRYFTVLSCGRNQYDVSPPDGRLCLTFIEGQGQNVQVRHREMIESWVAGLVSFDGGLTFQQPQSSPLLIAPNMWRYGNSSTSTSVALSGLTHNYAIHRFNRSHYTYVGGTFGGKGYGVFGVDGHTWHYDHRHHSENHTLPDRRRWYDKPTQWHHLQHLFDGFVPGCFEAPVQGRNLHFNGTRAGCVFDGRLSLVHFGGRYLLYARMNAVAIGQRFVQMTVSETTSPDGKLPARWMQFRPIRIEGYEKEAGNLYFFSVCVNPLRPDSLLALVPVVHGSAACIAISLLRDGVFLPTNCCSSRNKISMIGINLDAHLG